MATSIVKSELRARDRAQEESTTSHMPVLTHCGCLESGIEKNPEADPGLISKDSNDCEVGVTAFLKFILISCYLDVRIIMLSWLPSLKGMISEGL